MRARFNGKINADGLDLSDNSSSDVSKTPYTSVIYPIQLLENGNDISLLAKVVMEFPNTLEDAISWAQSTARGGGIFYCPKRCKAIIVPEDEYVCSSV